MNNSDHAKDKTTATVGNAGLHQRDGPAHLREPLAHHARAAAARGAAAPRPDTGTARQK